MCIRDRCSVKNPPPRKKTDLQTQQNIIFRTIVNACWFYRIDYNHSEDDRNMKMIDDVIKVFAGVKGTNGKVIIQYDAAQDLKRFNRHNIYN